MVTLRGGAVSYERSTPVPDLAAADELLAEAGPEMLDMESGGGVFASAQKLTSSSTFKS